MNYSVVHRHGGVTRADVAGLIRHEYRDIDKSNRREVSHSNEKIVPERTELNVSKIYIDGREERLADTNQIVEELDRRLENTGVIRTNKKTGEQKRIKTAKNAKVVRNIVLQLDPAFTRSSEYLSSEECSPEHRAEVMKYMDAMVDYYAGVYGRENLLASSFHIDETSPHMHLMVTPIDDQGQVRSASFIKDGRGNKSGYAQNDRAMRQHLIERGYPAAPEPTGINRNNMMPEDYDRYQQQLAEMAEREVQIEDRQAAVDRQWQAIEHDRRRLVQEKQSYKADMDAQNAAWRREQVKAMQSSIKEPLDAVEAVLSRFKHASKRLESYASQMSAKQKKQVQQVEQAVPSEQEVQEVQEKAASAMAGAERLFGPTASNPMDRALARQGKLGNNTPQQPPRQPRQPGL